MLDASDRLVSTREPRPRRAPVLTLVRSAEECAWAVRSDLPPRLADELAALAREEPPVRDLEAEPVHAARYLELSGGRIGYRGPAFLFPDALPPAPDVVRVEDERWLARHFEGWERGEIEAGRGPVLAVIEEGDPVSVCCCARRSDAAAAAGLETAAAFRGRGLGARVTAAWAAAVRASGRIPLYSAAWRNTASRAVARKLGLVSYASFWSVEG